MPLASIYSSAASRLEELLENQDDDSSEMDEAPKQRPRKGVFQT
jgi:hypothetical protein